MKQIPGSLQEAVQAIPDGALHRHKKRISPYEKSQGYGRILNIASINDLVGFAGNACSAAVTPLNSRMDTEGLAAQQQVQFGITIRAGLAIACIPAATFPYAS